DSLTSSGTLVWEGSASGASLWVSSFEGAGLTDCDASTQKVIWDDTNNKFSCGTDLNTGSSTAGQGITITSGVVSLSSSFSGTALEIMGTASGRILHAQDQLRSSGTLIVEGNATFDTDTLFVNAASDRVGIGTTSPTADLQLGTIQSGAPNRKLIITGYDAPEIQFDTHGSMGKARIVSNYNEAFAFHQDGNITNTLTASFNNDAKINIFSSDPERGIYLSPGHLLTGVHVANVGNYTGLNVRAKYSTAAGDYVDFRFTPDASYGSFGTQSNTPLRLRANATDVMTLLTNGNVGIGTTAPSEKLEVIGTASGLILHAQDSLTSSGTLVWEGSASGASLWVSSFEGAGLTDCDASTSKVIWDDTLNKFSCGTDLNTGSTYTAGQGLSLN
ncbi:MAG: hypothetical protein AAB544_04170, partial [Patescibacteria group bacterium]